MKIVRLALVGFGNVGQGMTQILQEKAPFFAESFGIRFRIVAVNDFKLGSLFHPDGLAPEGLLKAAQDGDLSAIPAKEYGWSVKEMIDKSNADTLVEASYTDLETGEPALGYIRQALQNGIHVATTNKGPIALALPELSQIAKANHAQIGFEGTVMSGTPALFVGQNLLSAANIERIQGILNGTTNYILTQMENGATYQKALTDAQSLGYAEADPTGDVEGYDAAGKVVILSNLLFSTELRLDNVERQGITNLTRADIELAKAEGKRWKLIATAARDQGRVSLCVSPTKIPLQHPLASVSGAANAITFSTATLGEVTLIGPGAGRRETGYALINDLLAIYGKSK